MVDGQTNGLRTVEISNMTIYCTLFPRTQLEHFSKRDEANKPGVYLLLGPDVNNPDQNVLYVGQGDPVLPRLKSHSNNKDFWTDRIVFSSKDEYLTKTQIKYLEAELYSLAKEAFRVNLDNTQSPTKPNISEVDKAEVEHFLDGIKLILSSLGIDILESRTVVTLPTNQRIYELKIKNAVAQMIIIDNQYVVLKDSTAVLENQPSAPESISKLRKDLVDNGIMVKITDGLFTFVQDIAFNSPSYAAAAIVGGAVNGRKVWKYNNKPLKEIERQEINGQLDN